MADYTGWISADERLPEESRRPYDVLTEDGQILEMIYSAMPDNDGTGLWFFNGHISPWKIAAWKPNNHTRAPGDISSGA